MERRDFIKISAITGATAALDSCGKPDVQLIRFIPEEELTPGIATWKPSICTLCSAGCGTLVKVMEGDAEVIRNGKFGVMKMGLAKKIEGNPKHPISQGKLCPRGQAMLQVTYHPDRIKHPLKRTAPRGSGQFQEIGWDEAIKELVTKLQELQSAKEQASLAFLSKPLRGQRRELCERFLNSFRASAPIYFESFDETALRHANAWSFGQPQLPTFDLAQSNYVISFGADFLGTWNSPVAQSIAYGKMRQGRPGQRAKFVQVEPRVSQTAANADEWIPATPGTEGILALGFAHVMMKENLRRAVDAGHAGELIAGWSQGLPNYAPEETERLTGVAAAEVTRLARELATHMPSVAIVGGAPLAHTNGLFTAQAINALNALLGSVEKPGGVHFMPAALPGSPYFPELPTPPGNVAAIHRLLQPLFHGMPNAAKVLLINEANPVFGLPANYRVREALEKVPFIVSFGSFVDESSVLADLILPDHSPLESWLDDIPESGASEAVVSLAPPVVRPLHDSRAMPDVLLEVGQQLGHDFAKGMGWNNFEEMLRARLAELQKKGSAEVGDAKKFWGKIQEEGGWWSADVPNPAKTGYMMARHVRTDLEKPEFDGPADKFPFYFLPFHSTAFGDGSLAHLPWLQEMPDPLSTAMWSSWVEINTKTAAHLGIRQGDQVEVESQHGKLQAPALLTPGIAPDVIAMPVGQGHTNFTRYASGRGANPISILAPMVVPETRSLAWAATRVKITKVGEGKLTLFAGEMREHPHEDESR